MDFQRISELLDIAKNIYAIEKPNSEMTDEEIALIARWFGMFSKDYDYFSNTFGPNALGMMLFITAMEFPEFYERWNLSQPN